MATENLTPRLHDVPDAHVYSLSLELVLVIRRPTGEELFAPMREIESIASPRSARIISRKDHLDGAVNAARKISTKIVESATLD
jgi:hypothetical protein